MTILMSGINMYSMAVVMKVILGWDIHFSIWVSSLTVAIYVMAGGLLSAIFNEVLQFFLIWLGCLLIPVTGADRDRRLERPGGAHPQNFPGQDYIHLWRNVGSFADNPMGAALDRASCSAGVWPSRSATGPRISWWCSA